MVLARGQDEGKIEEFAENTLPLYEEWASNSKGKFLLGTDYPTLLDIHCGAVWEIVYLWVKENKSQDNPYLNVA